MGVGPKPPEFPTPCFVLVTCLRQENTFLWDQWRWVLLIPPAVPECACPAKAAGQCFPRGPFMWTVTAWGPWSFLRAEQGLSVSHGCHRPVQNPGLETGSGGPGKGTRGWVP